MKKLLYFLLFIGTICTAQNRPIITKWVAPTGAFTISTSGSFNYTYQKVGSTVVSPSYYSNGTLKLNVPIGEYIVSITPTSEFRFRNGPYNGFTSERFTELLQWGDVDWSSNLAEMFRDCNYLKITATDVPNFSNVIDMAMMFSSCFQLENIPGINNWDVSKVSEMDKMFSGAVKFNGNISNWDVSKVTVMNEMFNGASSFNQNIANWNVSKVNNMREMFSGAESFNQNIGNWNVSNVTSMVKMFATAAAFNGNIANWNVYKVNDMKEMFNGAGSFNQNIGNWNVSNVTNMEKMFATAPAFNGNIANWDVNKVWNFNSMFKDAFSFNQNLGTWKIKNSNYLTLFSMFDNAGLSCLNYALTLKGWAENPATATGMALGLRDVKYGSVGKIYRDLLTTQKGWTFSSDIFEPTCNDALATHENLLKEKLNFYPNPTTGRIVYQSQTDESLQVFNTAGQLLKTVKVSRGPNVIDISEFPKGVYFLKAGTKTSKLLKN